MALDLSFLELAQEPTRNEQVAVGTTPILLSRARLRKELILVNSTAAPNTSIITLSFGKQAIVGQGTPLQPWATYSGPAESKTIYSGDIWVVSSDANGLISIMER